MPYEDCKYKLVHISKNWGLGSRHTDRGIHVESACQLHDVEMTRKESLHKGLSSGD